MIANLPTLRITKLTKPKAETVLALGFILVLFGLQLLRHLLLGDLPASAYLNLFEDSQVAADREHSMLLALSYWFYLMPNYLIWHLIFIYLHLAIALFALWRIARLVLSSNAALLALFLMGFLPIVSQLGTDQVLQPFVLAGPWFATAWTLISYIKAPKPTTAVLVFACGFYAGFISTAALLLIFGFVVWASVAGLWRKQFALRSSTVFSLLLASLVCGVACGLLVTQSNPNTLTSGTLLSSVAALSSATAGLAIGSYLLGLKYRIRTSQWFENPRLERSFVPSILGVPAICLHLAWFVPQIYHGLLTTAQPLLDLALLLYLPWPIVLILVCKNRAPTHKDLNDLFIKACVAVVGFQGALLVIGLISPDDVTHPVTTRAEVYAEIVDILDQQDDARDLKVVLAPLSFAQAGNFFAPQFTWISETVEQSLDLDTTAGLCVAASASCTTLRRVLGPQVRAVAFSKDLDEGTLPLIAFFPVRPIPFNAPSLTLNPAPQIIPLDQLPQEFKLQAPTSQQLINRPTF